MLMELRFYLSGKSEMEVVVFNYIISNMDLGRAGIRFFLEEFSNYKWGYFISPESVVWK